MCPQLPDGLDVRPATISDVPAVTELTRLAYARWVPLIGREPLPMGVDYEQALQAHRIDGVWNGSDLIALIETAVERDWLLVVSVAVHPEWQGQGVGRWLLALAETQALEERVSQIRLYTNARFEANIALYLSIGYHVERTEPIDGGTMIHMVKPAASPAN